MINYGLNRIFRHAQSGTVDRNRRNDGPDPLFFEEANTGSVKRPRNQGSKLLGREISQYGNAHHGGPFYIECNRHTGSRSQKRSGIFLLYSMDVRSRQIDHRSLAVTGDYVLKRAQRIRRR
jgi:hypothetical protein